MGRIEKLKRIRKMRIHREGTSILVISLVVFLILNSLSWYFIPCEIFNMLLTGGSLFIYLMMVNFFRSPKRVFPHDDVGKIVVAPADGKVVVIEEVFEPDHFKIKEYKYQSS
jgi:phosphatidylserine decarboxylase